MERIVSHCKLNSRKSKKVKTEMYSNSPAWRIQLLSSAQQAQPPSAPSAAPAPAAPPGFTVFDLTDLAELLPSWMPEPMSSERMRPTFTKRRAPVEAHRFGSLLIWSSQ